MLVALLTYPGVVNDECDAFRQVLELLPGAAVVSVGARSGRVSGPGGYQTVDRSFAELDDQPRIVAVPGGIGCEAIARGSEGQWLRSASERADWVLASSTGSVLLAAADLLRGRTAATHWLAVDQLGENGSTASGERIVLDPPFITCTGWVTALDAGLALAYQIGGIELEAQVRAELGRPRPEPKRSRFGLGSVLDGRRRGGAAPLQPGPTTHLVTRGRPLFPGRKRR